MSEGSENLNFEYSYDILYGNFGHFVAMDSIDI